MHDTPKLAALAAECLAGILQDSLKDGRMAFDEFERESIRVGHEAIAAAMSIALERRDTGLCSELPDGCVVHDMRRRTLAMQAGDVEFRYRRVRDEQGATIIPLADDLDIPWSARVSPGARAFLVEAGADVSYAGAARLLARAGGSKVSPTTVMACMRRAGALCREEDELVAEGLFGEGVLPGGAVRAEEVCTEADGIWVALQGKDREGAEKAEVKAMVAYSGKTARGRKVERADVVRHACVGSPQAFWPEAVGAMGSAFDMGSLRRVHHGTDGEAWCQGLRAYLPMRIEVVGHLDPFHVNRAIFSAFDDDKAAWQVIGVLADGGRDAAVSLMEACVEMGVARERRGREVLAYLRNQAPILAVGGPSLGTMESENQHLYGCRMKAFPCAWSRRGASDMARIRSRVHSGREIPKPARGASATPKRLRRDAAREERFWESRVLPASKVVQSVGKGSEPMSASLASSSREVRYAAGLDGGMIGIPW